MKINHIEVGVLSGFILTIVLLGNILLDWLGYQCGFLEAPWSCTPWDFDPLDSGVRAVGCSGVGPTL